MKTPHTLLVLTLTAWASLAHAQEKPVGLTYIDSIDKVVQTTAATLSMIECLPNQESGEIEIITIGSENFCIIRCSTNDKLFQFEYESMSWIKIPLLTIKESNMSIVRKIHSVFSKDGAIYVTLHWSGAEILGNDDERPFVYENKTIALSYLQKMQ